MVTIKISVRNLVEFIMRSGDLSVSSTGLRDADAMQEGTRIHKKLQRRMGSGYASEVALAIEYPVTCSGIDFMIALEGRADGIYHDSGSDAPQKGCAVFEPGESGMVVDEIKGVYRNIHSLENPVPVHRAQAVCYAFIYAKQHSLDKIGVRMTYCHIPTEEVRYFSEKLTLEEAQEWFEQLLNAYAKWAAWQIQWQEKRNASIQAADFPFPYRDGQLTLVKGVYQSILRKKRLYIEAPTGVGKTVSTVFPAVKSMGEGVSEKLFYLTAKTITRTVAEETFAILERQQQVQMKCVTLTAKEKICVLDKPVCDAKVCERAKGHFDRINDAVFDILTHETAMTREKICSYAEKHCVCPFEMSLDISTWCDAIIGDYNYAFDPTASLKRFFAIEKENDYVLLIDEAHNLVDRAREMYSAALIKEDFLAMKRMVKDKVRKAVYGLERCNRELLALKRQCDELQIFSMIEIEDFVLQLMRLCTILEEYFQEGENPGDRRNLPLLPEEREKLLNFYFDARSFQNIYELVDSHYTIYGDYTENGNFCLHLQCMDPSVNLDACLKKSRCSVFFSATLLPIQYYREQLAGRKEDYAVYAPSPFSPDRRLIMVGRDISTKYTMRGPGLYQQIASYILAFSEAKLGNYMVFFPSYRMLEDVREYLFAREDVLDGEDLCVAGEEAADKEGLCFARDGFCVTGADATVSLAGKIVLYSQVNGMDEQEREAFLAHFQDAPVCTTIGLCVMGGIFGEGIDLKDSRLIGAVIVGTGLPMVCAENELFKDYFDKHSGNGFCYAYQYPGMNKVLQAAGRVIRTTEDIGAVLLLDSRFLQEGYQKMFPREWFPYDTVTLKTMPERLRQFWEKF